MKQSDILATASHLVSSGIFSAPQRTVKKFLSSVKPLGYPAGGDVDKAVRREMERLLGRNLLGKERKIWLMVCEGKREVHKRRSTKAFDKRHVCSSTHKNQRLQVSSGLKNQVSQDFGDSVSDTAHLGHRSRKLQRREVTAR